MKQDENKQKQGEALPEEQKQSAEEKDVQQEGLGFKSLLKYPIVLLFFAFLGVFTIVDMVKPTQEMSVYENRSLEQMPELSAQALWDNEWTRDYGEFVRDQFLWRDEWVSAHSLFEVAQGKLESGGVWYAQDGYQIAKNETLSAEQERMMPLNIEALSMLAQEYPGQVHVMIVPSPAYMMADKLPFSPQQIDEGALTDDMFAQFSAAGAKVVDVRQVFEESLAQGEQVYYYTDHHWTTDGGAWLAYEQLCESLGKTPTLPSAPRVEVPGFLGTNFTKTKRLDSRQDTLVYYELPNQMTYIPYEGSEDEMQGGIMNLPQLAEFDKYAAFLHGNNGYSEIQGNGEGSVLVVKDSYANALVPYLVENYEKIGVVDLRNWFTLSTLIEQGQYEDIVVLYSFESFTSDDTVIRMMR